MLSNLDLIKATKKTNLELKAIQIKSPKTLKDKEEIIVLAYRLTVLEAECTSKGIDLEMISRNV
jgi:hypothetical protein